MKLNLSKNTYWKTDMCKNNSIRALFKAPSSYEKKIIYIIKKYDLPFKFTGDKTFIKVIFKNKTKRFCPDFTGIKNVKLLIEVYNSFNKMLIYHTSKNYENTRSKYLKIKKYKVLYLNEKDITPNDWELRCLNKIRAYVIRNEIK